MQQILAKNGQPLKLTWEDVFKQFDNLVKYAAKRQVESFGVDSMYSKSDLYQEGLIKLHECWDIWCMGENKDMDEFGPIFKKSLYRCVQKGSNTNRPTTVDIEDTENVLKAESEDVTERMYREEGLKLLSDSLSETAKLLLAELIEPSPNTLYEVWADIARKKMLKSQNKRVNVPQDNTVRMKHIVRSLGITDKQYDNAIKEIRENASVIMKR